MSISTNYQSFIDTVSTVSYQTWESINPVDIVHFINQPETLNPAVISIKIKDRTSQDMTNYNAWRIRVKKRYINYPGIDWFSVNSELFGLVNTTYSSLLNPSSNLIDNVTFDIQNLQLLLPGNYQGELQYFIEGKQGLFWIPVYSYNQIINLKIYDDETIYWDKQSFTINHIYQHPTDFGFEEFTINGPDWKVFTNHHNIAFSSNNPSAIINSDAAGTWIEGTGTTTIRVTAGNFYNTNSGLAGQPYNYMIWVVAGDTTFIGFIPYIVNVINVPLFVNPTSLNFNATIGSNEPSLQLLNIYATSAVSFTAPSWLNVIVTSSSNGITSEVSVQPIPYNNLTAGTYTGVITFSVVVNGNTVTQDVNVTYILNDFINTNYNLTGLNFTKDPILIDFFTQNNDTYFTLEMTVKAYDFLENSSEIKIVDIPFKLPLFNKKQSLNIGKIIEKVMYHQNVPLLVNQDIYKPANVNLFISEKKILDNSEVRSTTINGLKFIAGLSPKNITNSCGILELSNYVKRVYPSTNEIINFVITLSVGKSIEILKNNNQVSLNPVINFLELYREFINLENYLAKEGDFFEVKLWLDSSMTNYISKKLIVFPEPINKTTIFWEDEYFLTQSFDFGGKISSKKETENITFKNFNHLVEKLNKISSNQTTNFYINTGFISKDDIFYIDSIINSKIAWVKISNNKYMEIIPITKSHPIYDIDRELISYDLEFTINLKYNEENYFI